MHLYLFSSFVLSDVDVCFVHQESHKTAHLKDASSCIKGSLEFITINRKSPFACVDGRNDKREATTFGGSLAEFMLSLSSISKLSSSISYDVSRVMSDYLNNGSALYLHTDDDAISALQEDLLELGYTDVDIHNPAEDVQPILLDMLSQNPKYTGCGHIRLLQTDPRYYADSVLIGEVIRFFYHYLWEGHWEENMFFSVLHGRHSEERVVVVSSRDLDDDNPSVPAFCPFHDNHSSFVYHKDLVQKLRKSNSKWFGTYFDVDEDLLLEQMNILGNFWAKLTLNRLAKGLAVYELEVVDQNVKSLCSRF
ncbi:hypothetical protein GEMRC1_008760 [Eukaryota sp. GEM-RC1]